MKLDWKEISNKRISINQRTVAVLIIIALIATIALMSRGGSSTDPFQTTENPPIYQGDPSNLPSPDFNATGNYSNSTDIPTFTPPDDFTYSDIPIIPSINETTSSQADTTPPDPRPTFSNTGTIIPTFSDFTSGLSQTWWGTISWPTYTGGAGNDGNQNNQPGVIPIRPNKAGNLFNLSGIKFIPDINFNFIDEIVAFGETALTSILFIVMIFGSFYYSRIGIPVILRQLEKDEKHEGEESSVFFIPKYTEAELRRIEERKKKLQEFADFVKEIMQYVEENRNDKTPEDLILYAYYQLDYAFSVFHQLERSKDITPLEHANIQFESGEIDNFRLLNIVDLFYRTRFGKKEMTQSDVDRLLQNLENLALIDESISPSSDKKMGFFR